MSCKQLEEDVPFEASSAALFVPNTEHPPAFSLLFFALLIIEAIRSRQPSCRIHFAGSVVSTARLPPRSVGLGRKELAAKVAMADVHVASVNMQKAQTAPTVRAFLLFQGGMAMNVQKDSPNSAEIVAQAKAGREGLELNLRFRLSIASVVISLLVSAALKLLG